MSYKVILCDIEGTTTSISFVKENLFPYAAENVSTFLDSKWDADDTKEAVKMLRDQAATDKADNVDGCVEIAAETEDKAKQIETLVANVKWQMQHDRKAGPLKNLQGLMWVDAYKAGAFKGQVYDDVAPAFEAWTKAGRKVYIYSSGSAAIQKVHFEHSDAGDLAQHLSGYFDTKVGAKQDKASYEAIFKEITKDDSASLNTADVLFLTDIPAEAKAATEAGMTAMLLKRPGNTELTEEEAKAYTVVESFADIPMDAEATAPKRKIDDVANQDEAVPPAKVAKIEEASDVTTTTAAAAAAAEKPTEDAEMKDAAAPEESKEPKTEEKMDAEEEVDAKKETETVTEAPTTEKKSDEAEKKVTEPVATEDAPMAEPETPPVTEAESTTETEKTDEKTAPAATEDNNEQKKEPEANAEAAKKPEETAKTTEEEAKKPEEDHMEVDSTTAAAKEETKAVATETESKSQEAGDKTTETEAKATAVEEKPTREAVTATATAEEKKEAEVSASTETPKVTEEPKVTPAIVADTPTVNGDSAEAKAVENGDHDSDKENDKSMEVAKSDEVTTTQDVSEADEAAAKKLAEIDAVPVDPATEVEAES